MKIRNYFFKSTLIVFVFLFNVSLAQQKKNVTTTEKNGLTTVTFSTKKGDVTVHLPSGIHCGDVISGTVVAEPKGKNEKQVKKNKNILNGYVVELEDKKTPVNKKREKWEIPSDLKNISEIVLKDNKGKLLGGFEIPVKKTARPVITPGPVKISDFKIPFYIRPGEIEKITANFDGDFFTSAVKIDDKTIEILAESPEGIFFESPEGILGPVDVEIKENDLTFESQTNALDFDLSADKLTLTKREQTEVHISIFGMEGLEEEVPLEINNLTPGNINIEGGNKQEIIIFPEEISEKGTVQKDLKIIATGAGGFSVSVFIKPSNSGKED